MNDKAPRSDAIATKKRPPFNEVSVLFPLLSLATAGYIGILIADFTLKQTLHLPEGITPFYIALLGVYTADKKIRRWLGTLSNVIITTCKSYVIKIK